MTNPYVHYLSPFGAATWMRGRDAEVRLERDERRWSRLEELGMVSTAQRALGPPRIERG